MKHGRKCICMIWYMLVCLILTSCKTMGKEIDATGNNVTINEEKEYATNWNEVVLKLKETVPNEVPKRVEVAYTDNFIIDAEISIPNELSSYTLEEVKMKRHIIEDDEKIPVLEKILDETEWCDKKELKNVTYFGPENFVAQYENGKYDEGVDLEYENKSAWVSDLGINLKNFEFANEIEIFLELYPESYSDPMKDYMYLAREPIDLDFMPLDEAKQYVEAFAASFGIEFACETKSYVYSLERLEEMSKLYEEHKQQYRPEFRGPVFLKEHEMYAFVLQQGYKGVPILPCQLSKAETKAGWVNTRCYACVSENGIEIMSLESTFDILGSTNSQAFLSVGEVLEMYCENYGSARGVSETVTQIGLYYLPVLTNEEAEEFTAKPIWFVYGNVERYTDQGLSITRRTTAYDAVTGEKLAW